MFKKIFGIISCKGGVGKSTIAINLAISLSKIYNKKIGLLDADIYGPSHPNLLGISEKKKYKQIYLYQKKNLIYYQCQLAILLMKILQFY